MLRACCQVAENLRAQPTDPEHPERVIRVCVVCGARHIEVTVDPMHFGVVGGRLK